MRVPHVEWLLNGRQQSNNIWDNKVVMIFRKKLFIILGNRQCSIHTHSELTLVAWKYGSAYQVYCLFSTIQHNCNLPSSYIICHLFSSSLLWSIHSFGSAVDLPVGVPRALGNTDYTVYSYSIHLSVVMLNQL